MTNSTLSHAIKDTRATLRAREQAALSALQSAWTACKRALLDLLTKFLSLMRTARKLAGGTLPFFWLVNHNRLGTLKQEITAILTRYVVQVDTLAIQLAHDATALGNQAAIAQLAALDITATTSLPPFHLPTSLAWLIGKVTSGISSILMLAAEELHPAPEQSIERLIDELLWRGQGLLRTVLYEAFRATLIAMFAAVGLGWIWRTEEDSRVCFPAGTMIQTEHGLKNIEDIRLGERVLTHTGKYQRVITTSVAPGIYHTTTIRTEDGAVSATLDHPFLVERQGQLDWIEASDLRLGDHVFCQIKSTSEVSDHRFSERTIEWTIRQAYHPITSRLKQERFSRIAFFGTGSTMPVSTVNLETGVKSRQEEINRRTPAWKTILLPILNTQRLETKPRIVLGASFASKASITSIRAETTCKSIYWNDTKHFSAIQACTHHWWTATFLRTVAMIGVRCAKDFPATLARNIGRIGTFTGQRAASVFLCLTWSNKKILSTNRTSFGDMGMGLLTGFTAKFLLNPAHLYRERFTAMLALSCDRGMRYYASRGMWMLSLIKRIARFRATASRALPDPGRRNGEWCITLDTNLFHASIISHIDTHIHPCVLVYNLEVEEDHTYIANGFVVHNCSFCQGMDGTEHPAGEAMRTHNSCRCEAEPIILV